MKFPSTLQSHRLGPHDGQLVQFASSFGVSHGQPIHPSQYHPSGHALHKTLIICVARGAFCSLTFQRFWWILTKQSYRQSKGEKHLARIPAETKEAFKVYFYLISAFYYVFIFSIDSDQKFKKCFLQCRQINVKLFLNYDANFHKHFKRMCLQGFSSGQHFSQLFFFKSIFLRKN